MSTQTDTTIRYDVGDSSLGAFAVATSDAGICAVELADDPGDLVGLLAQRFPGRELERDAGLGATVASVRAAIDGEDVAPLALAPEGTAYQRRVWERLGGIAAGTTTTYLELARAMGDPGALRAVAGACAANPIAVIIPCHRVLRTDGALGGYRWGIERKRALLHREGSLAAPGLFDIG
jgi:AraC family transcriptional regulator of adaptative response/methylated-DNA-[protein]-cysteine methyltransferase